MDPALETSPPCFHPPTLRFVRDSGQKAAGQRRFPRLQSGASLDPRMTNAQISPVR